MSPQGDEQLRPAAYRPPEGRRRRRRLRILPLVLGLVLLVGGLAAWFVFTAQAVVIQIQPTPDRLAIQGGLSIPIGERRLLRPGAYTVVAEKEGYHRLEQGIEVGRAAGQRFDFELRKLPGRLRVTSEPSGASVVIDGEQVGQTPLAAVSLAPGPHTLRLSARRHQVHQAQVEIAGANKLQTLAVELVPAWAPVTVNSEPAGATLVVDGEARGTTPVTVELGAGRHKVALELEGYQGWMQELQVTAGEPQTLDRVQLQPALAQLAVTTQPAGASVSVDGDYRGRSPLTVDLTPGSKHALGVTKAGYTARSVQRQMAAGETAELALRLEPVLGEVRVKVTPADAVVLVDGEPRGSGSQTLTLTATAHEVRVEKPGYIAFEATVTPRPGLAQVVTAALQTPEQARAAATPDVIVNPAGGRMVLVQPGHFTMGSPRRSQGARANETQREVLLTRPFYIGATEVTNARYRKFKAQHSSGIVARETLDNPKQPVVRVSWAEAVAYCNWLSAQAGLPPAYAGGQLLTPVTTGYRLPSEAEWAYAARFAGGRSLTYPWGDAMPPRGAAGNVADTSAAAILDEHLQGYDDGRVAAAPVGSYAANALGLFDLGGNVAEWVHDFYSPSWDPAGVERDPFGPTSGGAHVARGSSWRHGRVTELRLAYREAAAAPRDDLGFRVARYAW